MLAPCQPPPPPGLSSMRGDPEAKVADFLGFYAADLDAGQAQTCQAIQHSFITKHLRTRVGQLFRLTWNTACNVCTAQGLDTADAEAWVTSFEDAAGFEFRERTVPTSGDLAFVEAGGEGVALAVSKGPVADGQRKHRRKPESLGMELSQDSKHGVEAPDWEVPEACYNVIKTLDPYNNPITEPELEKFTTEVVQAAGTRFGRYNFGMPFSMALGAKVATRLRKMPLGKGGKSRTNPIVGWGRAIWNKSRNRRFVRARLPCPCTRTPTVAAARAESLQEPAQVPGQRDD